MNESSQDLQPPKKDLTPSITTDLGSMQKLKKILKLKRTWVITAVIVLLGIGAGFLILRGESQNSITLPDGTKKELSLEETAYTGVAADVLTNQALECKPRNEHEWYRTDHTLVVDHKNPNTLYVSIEYKGIFKSVDGGKIWVQKTKGIKVYARADDTTKGCYGEYPVIRMDPKNNKHLVIGLSGGGGGFLDATTPNSQVGGVYQTYDGGESWQLMINNKMNIYVTDLAIDPNNPKNVYYSTASNPASWGGSDQDKLYVTTGLIYHTANSGKSWVELPTGIGKYSSVSTVMINPANGKQIVAPTFSAVRQSADGSGTGLSTGKDTSGAQLGILRTTNGGKTWTASQLPGSPPIINGYFSEQNFNNMFFVAQGTGQPVGYMSQDAGKTFRATDYMDIVAYDPHDSQGRHAVGYSTTAGTPTMPSLNLFHSTNGGLTWDAAGTLPKEITNLNDHKVRPSKIVWHPTDKKTLYMSGAGGHVWKTTDLGQSWTTLLDLKKLAD
jgi:photosystem II stability/assembly factor-like uncharacterized protein